MTQPATSIDEPLLPALTGKIAKPSLKLAWILAVIAAVLLILTVIIWQIVAAHGTQDPNDESLKLSHTAVIIDSGILVFREGLEAILVLAALTASLVRTQKGYLKPVALGAGLSFLASVATWFIAVAIIDSINAPALKIQAATGLLAIIVLLIIMNWFFHKVYWTGWITHHNRRKENLTQAGRSGSAIFGGLLLIGFTSVYREGFEVVLFLQAMRLKAGSFVVLEGVAIGLSLTLIVALLTFVAHYRLPYKRMLVLTGVMLGAVLLVMVGEQAQEMQQAGWLPSHDLNIYIPDWAGTWFSIFPNVESLLAQLFAATFVIGSYYLARRVCRRSAKPPENPTAHPVNCILPDCNNCSLPHDHQNPQQNLTQLTTPKK